ncbi:FabD/lysophospholipase-like protein [Mycena maculata]|uniref:Lysophospholipase n=1 Tax=Mycena maculata TaxID=230809 RepID=A0AAD7N4Q1_9AGAR|nr:FabD/lysophospholipase-like protein [Mycena maculata]
MKATYPSTLAIALGASAFAAAVSAPTPPAYGACPSNVTYVRPASEGLSPEESTWLDSRRPQVVSALQSYLNLAAIPGFNVSAYISSLSVNSSAVPVIGQSYSGGGTRASMSAIGFYQSFDSRYNKSVAAKTGGLSQATTYVAGLSGGCEATMALAINDFTDVQTLVTGGAFNNSDVPSSAFEILELKAEAGFNLSISDVIGINEIFYPAKGVLGPTFSSLFSSAAYANGSVPLPFLIMAEGIPPGLPGSNSYNGILFPINNATNQTIYEISPIEFGSWQGRARAFTPTSLLGNTLKAGVPVNESECVIGWDSSAWVLGAALSAQADWVVVADTNNTVGEFSRRKRTELAYPANETEIEDQKQAQGLEAFVTGVLPSILALLGNATIQEVGYGLVANPFLGYPNSEAGLQEQATLVLVDAGESGQESPVWPLIQPARKMDFLLVTDSSGAELSSGWMNGTNLINTASMAIANNVPFPKLPDVNTFLINNYTLAPVFFGCNEPEVPLLLFVADAPYSAYSNATTVIATGPSEAQIQILLQNTLDIVSQGNTTWAQCIACGSILRSLERLGQPIPDQCTLCFEQHCWQGEMATGTPPFVAPPLLLSPSTTFAEWNATTWTPAFSETAPNVSTTGSGSLSSAAGEGITSPACTAQAAGGHLVDAAVTSTEAESIGRDYSPVIIGLLASNLFFVLVLCFLAVLNYIRLSAKRGVSRTVNSRYAPVRAEGSERALFDDTESERKSYSDSGP